MHLTLLKRMSNAERELFYEMHCKVTKYMHNSTILPLFITIVILIFVSSANIQHSTIGIRHPLSQFFFGYVCVYLRTIDVLDFVLVVAMETLIDVLIASFN